MSSDSRQLANIRNDSNRKTIGSWIYDVWHLKRFCSWLGSKLLSSEISVSCFKDIVNNSSRNLWKPFHLLEMVMSEWHLDLSPWRLVSDTLLPQKCILSMMKTDCEGLPHSREYKSKCHLVVTSEHERKHISNLRLHGT